MIEAGRGVTNVPLRTCNSIHTARSIGQLLVISLREILVKEMM